MKRRFYFAIYILLHLGAFMFFNLHKQRITLPNEPATRRAKIIWTFGNLLMLVGIVLLLYVGGLYATDEYGLYAARGDTDVPVQVAAALPADAQSDEPAPFVAPVLNASAPDAETEQIISPAPSADLANHHGTITRVSIPSINVDSKVIEVGWDEIKQGDTVTAVWEVAKYAVGQNRGSANPGEGGNIVLAGHVGGFGKVFKDLFYVKPGDQITLYSNGQQYLYTVQQHVLVTEEGVSTAQQTENAQLIMPTDHEQITLVTCWPPTGPKKFTQRVVVQATPFAATPATQINTQSRWAIR